MTADLAEEQNASTIATERLETEQVKYFYLIFVSIEFFIIVAFVLALIRQ